MTKLARTLLLPLLALLLAASVACAGDEAETPTPSPTPTVTESPTATPSPTASPSSTPPGPTSTPTAVPPPLVALGETVTIRPGADVQLENGYVLRFTGVTNDSRCPVDVQCIWAGEATIELALIYSDTSQPLEITMPGGDAARLTDGALDVEVLSLAPEPRSTVTIAPGDYEVTLIVHALADPPASG